ncbi:MAG: GAF domain-containing protein [Anaerolineae bacterium]|nr:GAF domain-containing protein [Anaerolineae bacterium]MDQ7036922.1 GAF domain-containing protein [Anaerolineae bacterium]
MDTLLTTLFSTEHYQTAARKEQARLLYILASIMLIADVIVFIILPNSDGSTILIQTINNGLSIEFGISVVFALITLVVIAIVRFGYYLSAAAFLGSALLATVLYTIINTQESDFEYLMLATILVLSAITLGEKGLAVLGGGSVLAYALIFVTASPDSFVNASIEGFGVYLVLFVIVYVFLRYAKANRTEGRVIESAERFKLAEINTRITRQASERASLDETLNNALQMILENYPQIYHAQVFLINDDGVQARLVASTGETGQQLIQKGHSLAVGSLSVIGQTTFQGEAVIARSSDEDSVHRQNQLLAETRVEVAFPLQISDNIIGALDLQSREDLVLDEFDMLTFQSLANSLSLAIDNIRQFKAAKARVEENQRLAEQTRHALREVERLNQRLIGRAWSEYLGDKGELLGLNIEVDSNTVESVSDWTESLQNAAQTGGIVLQDNIIAVPLRVRGVVVGAMEFELDAEGEFTPADLELVQEVSGRFGLAAENTRLVEESQRTAQREALINEISTRLQSAINVEATLAEAARSLSDTLQANKVTIRLGIPERRKQSQRQANGATE